ncbi:hypothetical protein BDV23DRAFT_182877 [Aspergillus alliaceus]|uniref:Transaldolase n=1 Tax=Petromyces alliaceus TaxID=209559 RepID=A0A5N7CAK5_PETAA|nr:hypothetical protein BDV23DRAFT_182877 [Aspergillus alliaceus]
MTSSSVNVLEYLRSKTQVDLDALDVEVAKKGVLGSSFEDATSNQIDVFTHLENPVNTDLVKESISITAELHPLYPSLRFEELAVEVAGAILATRITPHIGGKVHLMVNPYYAFDRQRVVETAKRYHFILHHLNHKYDPSRIVIKVPATWEGMQACKFLNTDDSDMRVLTLATTVFSMEQYILAAEVGCVSVSPFINDLRRIVYPSHTDNNDDLDLDLCIQAQAYYTHHGTLTRVKACAAASVDQVL